MVTFQCYMEFAFDGCCHVKIICFLWMDPKSWKQPMCDFIPCMFQPAGGYRNATRFQKSQQKQKQIQFAKPYKICYCFFCWYTFEMQSKKRFNKKVQFRTGVGMWNHQSTHICVHHICFYLAVSNGRSLQYPTNITHISINKARYAFSGNHRIKF